MCKGGDVFSLAVLIDRGLDLVFRVVPSFPGCPTPRSSSLLFFSLYSVLRALSLNLQIDMTRPEPWPPDVFFACIVIF